ncbi:SRPBCC family protein [Nonomuraea cavernae]|uniref:SRPBCC family protein n=1 Tax=Nonomuraea cavernae TaxID=2045107 RepID=UPI00166343E0|nr:SRPBCC family protein [Nonomuraea cavernae]MCA2185529.1 SRPBCC family protein [Nonomuraea cavernae]
MESRDIRGWPRVALAGAASLAAYLLFVRPRLLRWGATRDEVRRPFPGDAIVPQPHIRATRAITIDAPPEAVWPWLAQMGDSPRAGWYGYDLADDGGPSADRIIPGLQRLKVGDLLPTGSGTGYLVEQVEPGRAIVLAVHAFHVTETWAIVLAGEGSRTRLLFRHRVLCRPGVLGLVYLLLSHAGNFLNVRKQLTTIKALAERTPWPLTQGSEPVSLPAP